MAAQYEPHPNSKPDSPLWNVTLPTGAKVPMAVSEDQLKSAGAMPVVPPEEDKRTAQLSMTPTGSATDAAADPFGLGAGKPMQPIRMDVTDEQVAAQEKAFSEAQKVAAPDKPPPPKPKRLLGAPEEAATPQEAAAPSMSQVVGAFRPVSWSTPARTQRTGYTAQIDRPFDEQYADEAADASIDLKLAEQRRADAEAAALEQQSVLKDQEIQQKQEDLQRQREQRQRVDAELNRRQSELDARRAEYRKLGVDPGKYFKDRGVLGSFAAAIASAAGTWAAMATGGRNYAKETIDAGIEREIAAQRDAIQKKGDEISGEENQLARLYQIHGDPGTAEKEFRIAAYDIAEERAKAFALRSQSEQVRANLDKFIAEIDDARSREMADLRAQARGKIVEQYRDIPAQRGYMSAEDQALRALERRGKLRKAWGEAYGEDETGQAIHNPFTGEVHGRLKETDVEKGEAANLREKVSIHAVIDEKLSRLKNLITTKNLTTDRKAFEQAQSTAKQLKFLYRKKVGTGAAMSESEEADVDSVVTSDPSTWKTSDRSLVNRLDETQANLRSELDTTLRSVGQKPLNWNQVGRPE